MVGGTSTGQANAHIWCPSFKSNFFLRHRVNPLWICPEVGYSPKYIQSQIVSFLTFTTQYTAIMRFLNNLLNTPWFSLLSNYCLFHVLETDETDQQIIGSGAPIANSNTINSDQIVSIFYLTFIRGAA